MFLRIRSRCLRGIFLLTFCINKTYALDNAFPITTTINAPNPITPRANTPTAPGEIGINPVDIEVPVGFNTEDFSYTTSDGKVTSHWLKKPDDWKTQGPHTTTKDNTQTTITTDAYSVKISTVSDPGQQTGIAKGDLYIELPPKVKELFENTAANACARKRNLEERQSCNARPGDFGNRLLDTLDDGEGTQILESPFEHVPELEIDAVREGVAAVRFAGRRIAQAIARNIVAIGLVFFAAYAALGSMPQQAKVPKQKQNPTGTYGPTSTTSSSQCPAKTDKPNCAHKEKCNGNAKQVCQSGKYKGCDCLLQYKPHFDRVSAPAYVSNWAMGQKALSAIDETVASAIDKIWCVNGCVDGHDPGCVCSCSNDDGSWSTYSQAASTTKNPLGPQADPTDDAVFFAGACPWISGDPALSSITIKSWSVTPTPTPTNLPKPDTGSGKCSPPANKDWKMSRKDVISAVEGFCDQKVCQFNKGDVDLHGFNGLGCVWLLDDDVGGGKKNVARITIKALGGDACSHDLTIDKDSCKEAMTKAIDCEDGSTDDDAEKSGGYWDQSCLRYAFSVFPYKNAGYPCIGTYNGETAAPKGTDGTCTD